MSESTATPQPGTANGPVGPSQSEPIADRIRTGSSPSSSASDGGGGRPLAEAEEPIKKLVAEMQAAASRLGPEDERLKQAVNAIASQAQDPARIQEAGFRTAVAYALQDFQKYPGETFTVGSSLTKEMAERAITSPGLTEPRLQALMAQTPSLRDRELVRNIRRLAQDSVNGIAQQGGENLNAKLDSLENRVRIAQPARVDGAPAATQSARRNEDPPAARPTAFSTSRSSGPGAGVPPRPAADRFIEVPARPGRSDVLVDLVRKLRMPVPAGTDAQMPQPAYSVDQRVSLFEKRMAEAKTTGLISSAERSGVAALDAAERFVSGPGRGILGKMQAAASTEPGGMETVMTEMRPGGRYADLRTEFDNAYQQDKIFAGAYDKMVESATQFGKDRLAVEANFAARGLDPKQLDGRFRQADEAISEATTKVPGRTPGKSALEELAATVAELFKRAYDGVKRVFGREATPTATHSPSPTVSM